MNKIFATFKISRKLNMVLLSSVFLSFHYYLIVYINSTFLSGYFSETQISTLYIIGAVFNVLLFLNISKLLNRLGNYSIAVYAIIIDALATIGLVLTDSPFFIGLYFVLKEMMIPLILFNLDVFLESSQKDESKTGEVRGMYLTVSNITLVISPAIVGFLLVRNPYGYVYGISFLLLIPLYLILRKYFKNYVDAPAEHVRIFETIREYLRNAKLYNTFLVYFILQMFYAFMIVYTPLYLEKYLGFSWSETGIMFTIMLLPFVLFELPAGDITDRKHDEREIMTVGLVIMGLATLFISFISLKIFWIWTIVLFITRTGAALVEVTVDSYFFKMVDQKKTDIISFYRLARPLSFVVTPLIATLTLQFLSFKYIFLVVGAICIIGARYSMALIDSK